MINTPVAFIIFNRPDLTERVFQAIRQAQPKKLLVIADGPRSHYPDEAKKCAEARAVINQVDWACDVMTNYSDINLGCKYRVSSGIDWVFSQSEEAILLEDDCLPHASFFRYCQELLDYYRDDERIWCISGNNFQDGQQRGNSSYYFSNYNHCWGWATWKRAWQHYDYALSKWPQFKVENHLEGILDSSKEKKYWQKVLERFYSLNEPNTWDYAWTFTCWQNRGLTALPNVNLVSNIGFRNDGTHTLQNAGAAEIPTHDIGEINHPTLIVRDHTADKYTFNHHYNSAISKHALFCSKVKSLFPDLLEKHSKSHQKTEH